VNVPHTYNLDDGRELSVAIESDRWSAWISGDERTQVVGFPLIGVIAEVLGFNPAHDEPSGEVLDLVRRVKADFPDASRLDLPVG
jgi:hypothetical protein